MFKTTALICAAALGLAACGSSSSDSTSSSGSASAGGAYGGNASSTTKTTAASSGGSEQTLGLKDNFFEPKTITGKPGSTVKIELKNEGNAEHNFTIDSQKVDQDVEAGEDASVTIKIPTSGSVQFYCEYHKGLGMTGTVKPA